MEPQRNAGVDDAALDEWRDALIELVLKRADGKRDWRSELNRELQLGLVEQNQRLERIENRLRKMPNSAPGIQQAAVSGDSHSERYSEHTGSGYVQKPQLLQPPWWTLVGIGLAGALLGGLLTYLGFSWNRSASDAVNQPSVSQVQQTPRAAKPDGRSDSTRVQAPSDARESPARPVPRAVREPGLAGGPIDSELVPHSDALTRAEPVSPTNVANTDASWAKAMAFPFKRCNGSADRAIPTVGDCVCTAKPCQPENVKLPNQALAIQAYLLARDVKIRVDGKDGATTRTKFKNTVWKCLKDSGQLVDGATPAEPVFTVATLSEACRAPQ